MRSLCGHQGDCLPAPPPWAHFCGNPSWCAIPTPIAIADRGSCLFFLHPSLGLNCWAQVWGPSPGCQRGREQFFWVCRTESLSCQGHISHHEETVTLPGEDRETGRRTPSLVLTVPEARVREALTSQAVVGQFLLRGHNSNNNDSSKHLHNTYYKPGIILRTAYVVTFLLLITALEYHHFLLQVGKRRHGE